MGRPGGHTHYKYNTPFTCLSIIGTFSLSEEDEQKLLAGQLEPQEDEQLQAAIQAMEK